MGAFALFYREFAGYLKLKIRQKVRSDVEAEDILEDFLVLILEKNLLKKFRGTDLVSLKSFLTRCLSNHLNQHFARRHHVEIAFENFDEVASAKLSPDLLQEQKEQMEVIEKCKAELPLVYRRVLDLQEKGLTQIQISNMLQTPVKTVQSQSIRAREMMRKLLKKYGMGTLSVFFVCHSFIHNLYSSLPK